jgi:hypothetical protein
MDSSTTQKKQVSANFFTELITFINRLIVVKPQEVLAILSEVLQQRGL